MDVKSSTSLFEKSKEGSPRCCFVVIYWFDGLGTNMERMHPVPRGLKVNGVAAMLVYHNKGR